MSKSKLSQLFEPQDKTALSLQQKMIQRIGRNVTNKETSALADKILKLTYDELTLINEYHFDLFEVDKLQKQVEQSKKEGQKRRRVLEDLGAILFIHTDIRDIDLEWMLTHQEQSIRTLGWFLQEFINRCEPDEDIAHRVVTCFAPDDPNNYSERETFGRIMSTLVGVIHCDGDAQNLDPEQYKQKREDILDLMLGQNKI